MKIGVIGTGYVGLVSGTCLAELGNDVICLDINKEKIEKLKKGISTIFEPGLSEMIKKNIKNGRLRFTTSITDLKDTLIDFIAVGTPSREDGSADLSYVLQAAKDLANVMSSYKIIVDKSTVPVGTADKVREEVKKTLKARNLNIEFDIVSNPEFLAEGRAVENFMKPDRIAVGTDSEKAKKIMGKLYSAETLNNAPIIFTDIKSAEVSKYASNVMLATRISVVNSIAGVCERVGADIKDVSRIMGSDQRIGPKFLYAGIGFGGSCFKKDLDAWITTSKEQGCDASIFEAANSLNEKQKVSIAHKIKKHFKDVKGKTFGVWGLAFKPQTDDMREAPSIRLIQHLVQEGAKVKVFDPEATENAKKIFGDTVHYCDDKYEALKESHALVLATEWYDFRQPDFKKVKKLLKEPVIFDGRNIYHKDTMIEEGFHYYGVGRIPITPITQKDKK
ncbi:UDP-glucose/GDP-mannose dehydrogenase family protein [Candidatus Woesearchaeota archaeon]|nr:UDP-glucose/GDP-mannose dehydrogenase family protein [Candidatus Woesearchaeota archaeon]